MPMNRAIRRHPIHHSLEYLYPHYPNPNENILEKLTKINTKGNRTNIKRHHYNNKPC